MSDTQPEEKVCPTCEHSVAMHDFRGCSHVDCPCTVAYDYGTGKAPKMIPFDSELKKAVNGTGKVAGEEQWCQDHKNCDYRPKDDTGDKPEFCSKCRGFAPFDGDHPHNPPTQSESELLDDILLRRRGGISTRDIRATLSSTDVAFIKRELSEYIAQRERAARIDELKRLPLDDAAVQQYFVSMTLAERNKRIDELTKEGGR